MYGAQDPNPRGKHDFEQHRNRRPSSPGALIDSALVCSDPDVFDLRDQYCRPLCRLHGARAHPPRVAAGRRGRGVPHRAPSGLVLCHVRHSDLLARGPSQPAQHSRSLSDHLVRVHRALRALAQLLGVLAGPNRRRRGRSGRHAALDCDRLGLLSGGPAPDGDDGACARVRRSAPGWAPIWRAQWRTPTPGAPLSSPSASRVWSSASSCT